MPERTDNNSWNSAIRANSPLTAITLLFLAGLSSILGFVLAPSTGSMIFALIVDFFAFTWAAVYMFNLLDEHPETERRHETPPAELAGPVVVHAAAVEAAPAPASAAPRTPALPRRRSHAPGERERETERA
jgi:hypothetical protein